MDNINIPEELAKLASDNFYEYIQVKAERYLDVGYEKYRESDAMHMPDFQMSNQMLELMRNGCTQIIHFRGLTSDSAFEDLGIQAFYKLMELFHYKVIIQSIARSEKEFFIDEMHMEHMVTGQKLTLYNKVNKHSI